MSIKRIETSVATVGKNDYYGTGNDGNVVISTDTSISRDMYYNNLTINSGVHLNTNGFKVFVKNTLTLNGSIGIRSTDTASTGTVSGNTPTNTAVTYAIGGGTQTNGVTQVPAALFNDIEKALGTYVDNAGTARIIMGGAGAPKGADGTLDTNTAGADGSAGSLGQYPPNAHTVNAQGGRGNTGATGSAGTYGSAGTGGTGGTGGAVVLVIAKNVVGSGVVYSQGKQGNAGTSAVNGTAGSTGATGAAAPSLGYSAGIYNYHHTRPAHHGGGDTHTVHMPRYHLPHYHHDVHVAGHSQHITWHSGGNHFHHTHSPWYATPSSRETHLNGVVHDHHGNPSHTGGQYDHFAHMYNHYYHHNNGWHVYYWNSGRAKGEHASYITHNERVAWSAGPAIHSYHYSGNWPGGAGGGGGAGGRAGTPTAGSAGYPGGGGGIIMLTESTPPVSLNTSGATSNGYTSSAGMQVIILNA